MKKLWLTALIFLAFSFAAGAQTYLMDNFKPSETEGYTSYAGKVDINGGLDWKGGFVLRREGYAKFNLSGQYENLRFVVGHKRNWNAFGDSIIDSSPTIISVWADDVKVYDGLVRYDGVPEHVTVRIGGAKSLTFKIVDGPGAIAFGEVTLWRTGQTPRQLTNLVTGKAKVIELVKDLKPYIAEEFYCVGTGEKYDNEVLKSIKMNGTVYNCGMMAKMGDASHDDSSVKANFYLRGRYSKLSFIAGPIDNKSQGSGWIIVKADGNIIYESEIRHDDTAKQIVLPIEGCDMISFQTEHTGGTMYCGFAKIMVYPESDGTEVDYPYGYETLAPADSRLKGLPDVTKLVSQVKPYSMISDLEKQIYDGSSEYVNFSMGGIKYSEGFILYEKENFKADNPASYVVFDLGNEFDYLRFTAGYVGESWVMQDDFLCVYADGNLILMEPLTAASHPKEYILPIRKCRTLTFRNSGMEHFHGTSAYGIADAVVYRGEDTSVNPFVHPEPAFPYETDLLDLGKPYVHFVSQYSQENIIHDGSSLRGYFDLNGQHIYKGFALKTGNDFPSGSSGEIMNNSCAAFNLYGQYSSLNFTVGCEKTDIAGKPSGYNETLRIMVDGQVVQSLTVYETMEPTTVTVPLYGCRQLMFWLESTGRNRSGKYVFYDAVLTKERLMSDLPKSVRLSEPVITRFAWDSPVQLDMEWIRPQSSGERSVDKYLSGVSNLYYFLERCMKQSVIEYEVHTFFLETNAGQICKAVRLMPVGGGEKAWNIPNIFSEAVMELEEIRRLRSSLIEINVDKANAALGLPALGLASIAYGKAFKAANTVLKHCTETLKIMDKQKTAEVEYLKRILDGMVNIDSRMSTERTIFCPVFDGETVPEGDKMMVDVFHLPEND